MTINLQESHRGNILMMQPREYIPCLVLMALTRPAQPRGAWLSCLRPCCGITKGQHILLTQPLTTHCNLRLNLKTTHLAKTEHFCDATTTFLLTHETIHSRDSTLKPGILVTQPWNNTFLWLKHNTTHSCDSPMKTTHSCDLPIKTTHSRDSTLKPHILVAHPYYHKYLTQP